MLLGVGDLKEKSFPLEKISSAKHISEWRPLKEAKNSNSVSGVVGLLSNETSLVISCLFGLGRLRKERD